MAAFNKFNCFVLDIGNGTHTFNGTFAPKIALTNSAPVATNTVLANITQVASGNGYTTGGNACGFTSFALGTGGTAGTVTLKLASPTAWTATPSAMGDFRYAVLYNDTPTSPADPLIGWWDYGSTVSLQANETFTITLDGTNGVLTIA